MPPGLMMGMEARSFEGPVGQRNAEAVFGAQPRLASHLTMWCANYLRMRKNYEEAQQRWRQAAMSSRDIDTDKRALRATFYKRNVAKERLVLHEQNCLVCNRIIER
jgi:hypothetical protein